MASFVVSFVKYFDSLLKSVPAGSLKDELLKLQKLVECKETDQKRLANNLTEALEIAKAIINARRKAWGVGKMIKKKKSKAKIEIVLQEAISDLQKACILIQFIALTDSLKPLNDQQEDGERIVLWVDDNPENNNKEATAAKQNLGLKVVQKISTAEAQDFLKANPNLLKADASHFRVVTDCYREDEGESAGRNLIKWLRETISTSVCVYCSNMLNVLDMQVQFSNVLAASTPSQLALYFSSMFDKPVAVEEGKEELENDAVTQQSQQMEEQIQLFLVIDSIPPVATAGAETSIQFHFVEQNRNLSPSLTPNEVEIMLGEHPAVIRVGELPGHFSAVGTLEHVGKYELSCTVAGKKIDTKNGPVAVNVELPQAFATNCRISSIPTVVAAGTSLKFAIQAMDKLNKELHNGGAPFVIKVTSNDDMTDEVSAQISDNNDGTYLVCTSPFSQAASYSFRITLNSIPIAGSPFNIQVIPAAVDPERTVVEVVHSSGLCGEVQIMKLLLYDKFDNDCSLHDVDVVVDGPSHLDVFVCYVDEVMLKYFPVKPGNYTLSIKQNGLVVYSKTSYYQTPPATEQGKKRKNEVPPLCGKKAKHPASNKSKDLDATLEYQTSETKQEPDDVSMTVSYDIPVEAEKEGLGLQPTVPYDLVEEDCQPTIPYDIGSAKTDVPATVAFTFDSMNVVTKSKGKVDSGSDTEDDIYKIG